MDKPIWSPSQERIERANLNRFMRFVREETGNADLNSYAPLWQFSIDHPERFWTLLWDFCGIRASGAREPVIDTSDDGIAQWFPHIRLNITQNLLRFDDERTALLQIAQDGSATRTSFAELRTQVAAMAAALRDLGVGAGDRLACDLAPGIERSIAWLAGATVGGVWLSNSDGTADTAGTPAPALRITDALRATDPFSGVTIAVGSAETHASERVHHWDGLLARFAGSPFDTATLPFNQPLIERTTASSCRFGAGGLLMQHLKELVLHLDVKREDKLLCADPGGLAGDWIVSALALGAAVVIPTGTLDDRRLWNLVDEHGITVVLADSARLERMSLLDEPPRSSHKLLALKTLVGCGHVLSAAAVTYAYEQIKDRLFVTSAVPATDTLGCALLGAPLLPVHAANLPPRALAMPQEQREQGDDDRPATFRAGPCAALPNNELPPADASTDATALGLAAA